MKISPAKAAIIAGSLLILILISFNLIHSRAAQRGESTQAAETLDRCLTKDFQRSYSVFAFYHITSAPDFDVQTHRVLDLSIVVRESRVDGFKDVFSKGFNTVWEATTGRPPPTWANRYIPVRNFVLPTGRVFEANSNVYFILFEIGRAHV